MDLLLQAARVLELENSGSGADRVSSKSTRGTYFLQHARSTTDNGDILDGLLVCGENGIGNGDEDISLVERTSRRVGGVGTREVHNQLEKNRRKQLREFFTHLQQCVPSLENKRVATQSILQGAIKHIKNLKKKDVEQEREIQMLAKRKSELKKKYDLEFNRCTEEQQRMAQILLSVIRSKIDVAPAEQDGHTSDSTSTASEGPSSEDDFSDEEQVTIQQSLKTNISPGNSDGRKRKITPRAVPGHGIKTEPLSGSSRSGVCARSLISSSVSSSSVALKHMLEQRKRNQTAAADTVSSQPRGVQMSPSCAQGGVQISTVATRGPGSLTFSYPMITTHLASAIRPAMPMPGHGIAQTSQLMSQPSMASVGSATLNSCTSPSTTFSSSQSETAVSTMITPATGITKKGKKTAQIKSKGDNSSLQHIPAAQNPPLHSQICSTPSQRMVSPTLSQKLSSTPLHLLSESPLKVAQSPAVFSTSITMVQPPSVSIRTPEVRKMDSSFTVAPKVVVSVPSIDVQGFGSLGKAVTGSHTGALTFESAASVTRPQDVNISSSKMLPTIIPFSLASFVRGLSVSAGQPHTVSLASSPLVLSSSTDSQSTTSVTTSSILNSKLHLSQQSSNFLLTGLPVTTQHNSVSLSTNNARVATLLVAPSAHINNSSVIKSTSPINNTASSICPSSIAIPGSLAPTLLPLTLTSAPVAANASPVLTPGTPLRIFTQLPQNPVMTTSLTNGQSPLLPTVVQLETGQVALLQNLIPGQHVQVQNPHHILAQPIVVMATAGSNFGTASSTATTSSSSVL